MKRNERLQTAVDRLASLTEGGHLLASTDPATLINTVVDKYLELRAKAAKWDSYQAELANEKTHTDRFISLMDAEEDELRRKAEEWEKVEKLYPNVAAYITDPDEYTRKMKALKEST